MEQANQEARERLSQKIKDKTEKMSNADKFKLAAECGHGLVTSDKVRSEDLHLLRDISDVSQIIGRCATMIYVSQKLGKIALKHVHDPKRAMMEIAIFMKTAEDTAMEEGTKELGHLKMLTQELEARYPEFGDPDGKVAKEWEDRGVDPTELLDGR